jgi:hypothetical protein
VAALLLALASVLGPLAHNLHQASPRDAVPALIGTAVLAVLVWLVAVASRRRADAGAALIACVWVIGVLYYLELVRHLNARLGGDYTMIRPLPIALVVLIALTLALRGTHRWQPAANTILASIAVAVLAVPVWQIAAYEWRHRAARDAYDPERAMAEMPQLAGGGGAATAAPPDIYHIVFDRYGSEETLARHFGIRDPIGAWLEARGFYVARESFSNYMSTGPSLWVGTYHNPNAVSNRPLGFSEFNMTYLRRTMLMPVFHLLPDWPIAMRLDWDNAQCQRVARQLEEIKRLHRNDRPLYVFAHILVPHEPYVFGPDGRCLTRRESDARGRTQGYAEQVAYADAIIREVVAALLAEDRPPPVILIQADEGPIPEPRSSVPWQDASKEELRIKFGILNAFYFPGGDYSRLRQDISPVNSYRVLLGTTFGLDLPDLPDRMFAFPDDRHIYDLHDVTERTR